MHLVSRQSAGENMLSDSNLIETVSEEGELLPSEHSDNQENKVSPNNDSNNSNQGKNANVPASRRRVIGDRPRLVDRTVSEGQLLVPKKNIREQEEEDRPDFYEFRAKGWFQIIIVKLGLYFETNVDFFPRQRRRVT